MRWLSLLARWALLAAAVALTAWVLPEVSLEGGVWSALWVALIFGLVNVVAQLLLTFLPRPSGFWLLLTLTLMLNGALVWAVSALSSHFEVDGFVAAVGAAMLITVFSVALSTLAARLLPDEDHGREAVPG